MPSDIPAPAPSPGSLDPRLAQDLTVAASRFARTIARRADVGVSSVAWRLCSTIHRRGPLRLSEIADAENVTRPTATATVHRLEVAGLVCREPDAHDHRSSLIDLTPAGLEALRRWTSALGHAAGPLLGELSDEDLATLYRATALLHRLADAAEHDHTPPPAS
ncbi:MarR family winged helix-turn-helix transcriptional regulator [Brachybacterium sillae]|uniref:MarR family winged helix-turn-helix transcriptional regulator n=1 Tax=Brachybacterium sillae TaxID=2810536 RepID=UPI00217D02D7|nr:MarR family transcriptional regulator [Brachybacterium sillae]